MSIQIKPYELSLWEDVLTFVVERADGIRFEYENSLPEDAQGVVVAQYYKERKICIIGSDTMNTPIKATQAKLVSKINGENILTFNMYSHYYGEDGNLYTNPFIGFLVNERKIKLRYGEEGKDDTKWYDLIIKNIQENSETKTYSYTAKDLFVNELSKSGFSLEFNAELENNTGNVETLASYILDESDWQLKHSNAILQQTVDEPVYEIILNQKITAESMESDKTIEISAGSKIYGFYTNIVNQDSFLQFLYVENGAYEFNDDNVITNSVNWCRQETSYNNGKPAFAASMAISSTYRGKRLVRKAKTTYDATIDKYVNVYDNNGQEIYGYSETEYTSSAAVRSYVTNPNGYDSYTGWEIGGANKNNSVAFPSFQVVSVPDVRDVEYDALINNIQTFASCLELKFDTSGQVLYNSGIIDHRHNINGFAKGEKYVFRIKYGKAGEMGAYGPKTLVKTNTDLICSVNKYTLTDGVYNFEKTYFQGTLNSSVSDSSPDYVSVQVECMEALSYADMAEMTKSLGLFIRPSTVTSENIYIEDVQFFPYVVNDEGIVLPDEPIYGEVKTKYSYYIPSDSYTSIDDVQYVYRDYTPAKFAEVYNDEEKYEKVRSIIASESNRFNLIQELCEIFECWAKFEIEHKRNGEIELDENYRQKKWVSFHEYIGKENYAGFKYGINLKSIQRIIDSETIVSKMVVKDNSNEFATDGYCSIARASENPSGENFLLDFSYYTQQKLMGLAEITNDLYLETNGYIGYYKQLKRINNRRDQLIKEQSGLITDIAEYSAAVQTYTLSVAEAEEQLADKYIFIKSLTGFTFQELLDDKENEWWDNDQVISATNSIGRLKSIINNHSILLENAQANLNSAQELYDRNKEILTSKKSNGNEERLLIEKETLHRRFYKKYSRFLQEGSWISEDYIDDNLYCLDAQSTLHTSSQPKVTYNILVLELSQIEGYENYTFSLGDKTTIEDTEFFGWTLKEGVQTPYKEEIVVTEITVMLDSPEQNQIKVQNYKTQFEDLFQRMAATTQTVEYSTGQYQKVSSIVEKDGTINIVTLQNSIANNALTLQNSKDQSVVWDETGITTTSLSAPSEIVRIVSGGIFLSTDGGITWNTGVTAKGINASYITSGKLNVEEVNVLNGSFPSFRWDKAGISAYAFTLNEDTNQVSNFNYGKFIRLDQYGLYGINGDSGFDSSKRDPETGLIGEERIWDRANFALTWKGFQIKSNAVNGGYVSITSENDIEVKNGNGRTQVKLGMLYNDTNETIYGLRLNDKDGNIVMEHSSDGKIWILNELKIGAGASTVSLGYLEKTKKDTNDLKTTSEPLYKGDNLESIRQVFNAADKFIIHEDGSMRATDGEFTGTIYATGGKIGNLDIQALQDTGYEVVIESDSGTVFKNGIGQKTLTARLYKGAEEITTGITDYQWSRFNDLIPENQGGKNQSLVVDASDLDSSSERAVYSCAITYGATS